MTLEVGQDTLAFDIHEHDWIDYNESRVDVYDFKAEDRLEFSNTHNNYEWFDHGQVLDRLDVNNDGWLGAKDVEALPRRINPHRLIPRSHAKCSI